MPIDTISHYSPEQAMPVYLKVGFPRHNDYKVGSEYEMRIFDPDTERDTKGGASQRFVFTARLVSIEDTTLGELDPMVVAMCGMSAKRSEAISRIAPGDPPYDDDREVQLLTFIRPDKVKEMVTGDLEPIEAPFTKSHVDSE